MLSTAILFEKTWSSAQIAANKKLGATIRGRGVAGKFGFMRKKAQSQLSQNMRNRAQSNLLNRKSSAEGQMKKSDLAISKGARTLERKTPDKFKPKAAVPSPKEKAAPVKKKPNVPLMPPPVKDEMTALRFMNA